MMPSMSESPESTSTSTSSTPPAPQKPYWLYRLAAWVGIIAGIVFIVSSIFFAGAYVGRGGWHGHHGHHCHHHQRDGAAMFHKMHHDRGPGDLPQGSENAGPGEVPQSVTQSPPAPGR